MLPLMRSISGLFAIVVVCLFLVPISTPLAIVTEESSVDDLPWWETTNMDKDRDQIHDAVWMAVAGMSGGGWVDSDGRIGVIVDFDHSPTEEDEVLLESSIDFIVQWRYHLIDSIAGKVAVDHLYELTEIPGVVLVELDGRLEVQMEDVVPYHGVDSV
ncbi:MAG: hypothetical protein VYB83_06055, partial [Candidatus Thermoplasmatota archaeon]|nr:hypothetical protein [Candidatus Thermoplasmatota archaeon]